MGVYAGKHRHVGQRTNMNQAIEREYSINQTIDVIIPVYRGYEETLRCIDSVLESRAHNKTKMNIIVINDASPEPKLVEALADYEPQNILTLLHNEQNLGFVGTVNRGMSQSSNDVVLLNSDTEVANDWLDRMVAHVRLAAHGDVATVTPYSNNATLCSYPQPFAENNLLTGETLATMHSHCATANNQQSIVIPTGVGFCFLITRVALDKVGLFDEAAFGKGYGEENDFCLRASQQGFVNLHALDVFVWHKGAVSFSETSVALQAKTLAIILQRYPDYEERILAWKQDMPSLPRLRIALQALSQPTQVFLINHFDQLAEKIHQYSDKPYPVLIIGGQLVDYFSVVLLGTPHTIQSTLAAADNSELVSLLESVDCRGVFLADEVTSPLTPVREALLKNAKGVLHIVNNTGGGTLRYVESLANYSDSKVRHFILYMSSQQPVLFDVYRERYHLLNLRSHKQGQWQTAPVLALLAQQVGQIGVHLHSMFGDGLAFAEQLPKTIPLLATLHDHYFLSDNAFANNTITANPRHIERIQRLLKRAEKVIVPSKYLYRQAQPYFSKDKLCLIHHGVAQPAKTLREPSESLATELLSAADWDKQRPTVAIVGAIGVHKGLGFMKKTLKQLDNDGVQVVHLGYTSITQTPFAQSKYIQHGAYHHDEIPLLLQHYGADIVIFFPGIPESFCYALSDIYGTLPVLAPKVGAFIERVPDEQLGDLYDADISPKQLKTMIIKRLTKSQTQLQNPERHDLDTMVVDTEHFYAHVDGEDWHSQGLTDADIQAFLSENLHEENLKLSMVHLSRENYQLRCEIERLHQLKEVSLSQQLLEKLRYLKWRTRHNISRAIRLGPTATCRIIWNRLRGIR